MADEYTNEGWELRSFSSGKLKKSSSVEILLGTHPTKGRMLATSPLCNRHVTHDMKGSGRPAKGKVNTLPPSSNPKQNGNGNISSSGVSSSDSDGKTVPRSAAPGQTVGKDGQGTVPKLSQVPKEGKAVTSEVKDRKTVPLSTVPSQSKPGSDGKTVTSELKDTNAHVPQPVPNQTVPSQKVQENPTKTVPPDFKDFNFLRREPETPPVTSPVFIPSQTSSIPSTPLVKDIPTPQAYPNTSQTPQILSNPLINPQTFTQPSNIIPKDIPTPQTYPNPTQTYPNLTQTYSNPLSTSIPQQTSFQGSNITPKDVSEPQTQPNPSKTPPVSRNLKSKGSHLPPLVTTHKQEQQSPKGTPRGTPKGTPKGTPIIGKRGHVFSVSTPEVEPETGHPLPPLPFEAKLKRSLVECLSDPFEYRRNVRQPETEKKDGGGGGGGGGGEKGEEEEPIWQRRLSLLFVPPTEDELEPEKEVEETTRLLPVTIAPQILRKQTLASVSSSPYARRREREERATKVNKKREKEGNRRDREKRSNEEKERLSRINFEEERNRSREERRKGKEDRKGSKFSRLRHSSASDDPESSLSSVGSSEEERRKMEEEEEEEEEERVREDDYTSWDDTICSNRSAYFKKYYTQRSVTERSEDKESSFRSPFDASHNSLSSLIKERMTKSSPSQAKNTTQLGLVVLVVVLLVVIVVGISLTYYFYNLHLLELSIFNRIKFYEGPRHLEVYDPTWNPVLTLHLGTNLPQHSLPEDCTDYLHYLKKKNYSLPHHGLDDDVYDEMICLDWTSLAQLHLRKLYASGTVQCYTVWWVALKHDFTLRDCLLPHTSDYINRNITWWGGGEMTSGGYPVTNGDVPPSDMVTGRIDRDPWGQILRRMWLSDQATLLMLPARFRGQVSINYRMDEKVCLEMPVTACTPDDPNLSYTLCTAPNLTELTGFMHQRAIKARQVVGLAVPSLVTYTSEEQESNETQNVTMIQETFSPEVLSRIEERLEHPVYIPWMKPDKPQLTQEGVLAYIDGLNINTTEFQGHVLLPPTWQTRPGEMDFDPQRFPDPLALSEALKAKGFDLALTLHPFISVDAPGFNTGLREGLWVRQKNSLLPALAKYDERHPSVVTDFTNPRASQWYASQLQKLKDKYSINHFHLNPTDAHVLPTFHEYHTKVQSPDDTIINFMASVSTVSPPLSTSGAIMPPMPPTFVTLGSGDGFWHSLETLIPRVLTLSMLGFPFLDVGPIGGVARAGYVPDRELYIRWIEAAAFLPSMQISVPPRTYGHEIEELAQEYDEIRKTQVLPRLMEKIPDAIENGTPLITPLSVFLPHDKEAAKVDDQWMLGNDLLVAPVVRRGERTRTFYLPKGIWKDGIDGNLKNGGRWVRNYKVPLTKIPHFYLRYVDDFER